MSDHDDTSEAYLRSRRILDEPSGLVRYNIGTSGDAWLDGKARLGYRVAVALHDATGLIRSIAVRFAGAGEPPDGRKILNLAGAPSAHLLFAVPTFWTGAEPDDPVLLVEGATDFLSALLLTNSLAEGRGSCVPWPFGLPGAGTAGDAIRSFSTVFSGRRVVLALDADDAGQRGATEAAAAARELNSFISFISYPPGVKDLAALVARLEEGAA